jgi:hypothetical protein
MKKIQYTIRGVPEQTDLLLRKEAVREGKSLNATLVETLAHAAGQSPEEPCHHDLDAVMGTWVEDPEFDRAIQQMDSVDKDLWR